VNRILKPIVFVLAVIYFLVDAVFMPVAKWISEWVAEHWVLKWLRNWIVSLRPYPTLLLFTVPVVVLEPIKPISLCLMGMGYVVSGMTALVVGELLKLVLIERLFHLSRDKLMVIPAFAWSYGKYRLVRDWIVSSQAWQNVRRWSRLTRCAVRRYLRILRASHDPRRLFSPSR
jgi:hypothetical protein